MLFLHSVGILILNLSYLSNPVFSISTKLLILFLVLVLSVSSLLAKLSLVLDFFVNNRP